MPLVDKGGFEDTICGICYYVRLENEIGAFWKIGVTHKNVKDRFRNESIHVTIIKIWKVDDIQQAKNIENEIRSKHSEYLLRSNCTSDLDYFCQSPLENSGNSEVFIEDVLGLDDYDGQMGFCCDPQDYSD